MYYRKVYILAYSTNIILKKTKKTKVIDMTEENKEKFYVKKVGDDGRWVFTSLEKAFELVQKKVKILREHNLRRTFEVYRVKSCTHNPFVLHDCFPDELIERINS